MRRIIDILFVIFIVIMPAVTYLQYEYVSELKKQIADRDRTITKYESNDSIYNSRLKQYTDTVEKYISPSFTYGNKEVSTDELLEITNSSLKENDMLKYQLKCARDSISAYKELVVEVNNSMPKISKQVNELADSAIIYKGYVELTKQYGFKFTHKKDGNRYTFFVKAEKVDSALLLLPYFRDRLIFEPEKGSWSIITRKGLFKK